MITPSEIANFLMLAVALGMWSIVIFKIWPELWLDRFRQSMFSVRDDLFDFAAKGNISFEDPAYVLLRRQMNGFIRFGHQLSVFRLLMTKCMSMAIGESDHTEWHDSWNSALENVKDHEVRSRLMDFQRQGAFIAISYLIGGSPVLWLAVGLSVIWLGLRGAALGTKEWWTAAAKKVLIGPLARRRIEEAASACAH